MIEPNRDLTTIKDDAVIWRYMNFASFYSIVSTQTLFFRRLDRYADKLEATLSERTLQKIYEHRDQFHDITPSGSEEWARRFADDVETGRRYILSNSWTISDHEEYALWKIYLDGCKEGVAITSTGKRLMDSLQGNDFKISLGKVSYDEPAIDFKDINIYVVATNKRKAYSYENEYRALIPHQHKYNRNTGGPPEPKFAEGTSVNVDLKTLIDKIYLSPFAGSWFSDVVKSMVRDYLDWFDTTNLVGSSIRED